VTKKYEDDFEKQESYKLTKEDSMELAEIKKAKAGTKEPADTSKNNTPEIKKEDAVVKKEDKDSEEVKKEEPKNVSVSPIIYKVQIASSDKKIPLDSDKFKGVEKPGEYEDKGIYKYTSGEFSKQEDAIRLQSQLRKNPSFKDAFVIAMQDGKRIPLK
jgi:N-acetylmuramoyl-L-alanine amidase